MRILILTAGVLAFSNAMAVQTLSSSAEYTRDMSVSSGRFGDPVDMSVMLKNRSAEESAIDQALLNMSLHCLGADGNPSIKKLDVTNIKSNTLKKGTDSDKVSIIVEALCR